MRHVQENIHCWLPSSVRSLPSLKGRLSFHQDVISLVVVVEVTPPFPTPTRTLFKIATPSTCPVCGKKSKPLMLSISYLHCASPGRPLPCTNLPMSLACVWTLQLT